MVVEPVALKFKHDSVIREHRFWRLHVIPLGTNLGSTNEHALDMQIPSNLRFLHTGHLFVNQVQFDHHQ